MAVSFSANAKTEVCRALSQKRCCAMAECFGILLFCNSFTAEGIKISAVTVQNEAHAVQTWESCLYTAEQEADFAVNYLRPALDQSGLSDVKIIIWDQLSRTAA